MQAVQQSLLLVELLNLLVEGCGTDADALLHRSALRHDRFEFSAFCALEAAHLL
jgi:hypothetical protein